MVDGVHGTRSQLDSPDHASVHLEPQGINTTGESEVLQQSSTHGVLTACEMACRPQQRALVLSAHLTSGSGAKRIDDLRTPCCVVDHAIASANAARMLGTAQRLGCKLRPHVKSHKTIEGALLQTGGIRERIVVSTLAEACFFADNGFDDIL